MHPLRVYYGGSFDPVHNGHLAIARDVRDALQARVILVPARHPPHKTGTRAPPSDRARMLELAIAGEPGLGIDCRELSRDGPSYTVDTLASLRAELGTDAPIAWLVGADSLLQLDRWHRWADLFRLAHLLVVRRPGSDVDAALLGQRAPAVLTEIEARWLPPSALAESASGGFCLLPLRELRPESSTLLRERIVATAPWRDWVAPAVADYILREKLYGTAADILPPSPQSPRP